MKYFEHNGHGFKFNDRKDRKKSKFKNNKGSIIREGDILQNKMYVCFAVTYNEKNRKLQLQSDGMTYDLCRNIENVLKAIGNVYDNPDAMNKDRDMAIAMGGGW